MAERQIMMPVPENQAATQMLIDQVRRLSDAVDRFTEVMQSAQLQLARLEKEHEYAVERRAKTDAWIQRIEEGHDRRLGALEGWRKNTEGRDGVFAWFLRSPVIGWLAGAALAVWVLLKGHGQ